jgi:hypothetical protein
VKSIRKYLFITAVVVLAVFFSALGAEYVHHHDDAGDSDHCAFCSWILTASQAPSAPAPPVLLPVLLFFVLFFAEIFFDSYHFISPCGRSPPNILL